MDVIFDERNRTGIAGHPTLLPARHTCSDVGYARVTFCEAIGVKQEEYDQNDLQSHLHIQEITDYAERVPCLQRSALAAKYSYTVGYLQRNTCLLRQQPADCRRRIRE